MGPGMPVVRNPQFNFREGFCWSAINTIYLKCRKKGKSVNDVQGMSLYISDDFIPVEYVICLLNSDFISNYVNDFVNNTSIFQINDARQLPIIIPADEVLAVFVEIFNSAFLIKRLESSNKIDKTEAAKQLTVLQEKLDVEVRKLYGV